MKMKLVLFVVITILLCAVGVANAQEPEPQIWVKEYKCDTVRIGYSGFTTSEEYPGMLWIQDDSSIKVTLHMESPGTLYGTFEPQCRKPNGGYVLAVFINNLDYSPRVEIVTDLETPEWEECESVRLPILTNSK